ncbi:hypothetical protein FKM82_002568 [Ascaphus truei]
MASSMDFRTDVDLACRAAEEFVNIYYETIDKRRRLLTKLYMDTATLVWNGNPISGQEALIEFFEMLPSSEFQVNMFDCQPVHAFPLSEDVSMAILVPVSCILLTEFIVRTQITGF